MNILSKSNTRAALEVAVEFSAIFLYIWVIEIRCPAWFRTVFFWLICVGFPLYCIWTEQKTFPEFSLDWDQFVRCLRGIVWFTLAATVLLIAIALHLKNLNYDGQFPGRLADYFFWAFLQQIGLQTFLTTRVRKVLVNRYGTAFVSATLFAFIHLPNTALVIFSWIGAFFWTLSFQQSPNLYALAASHGWLATFSMACVPAPWIHALKIGPGYWKF